MFENLSERLSKTLRNISGKGSITENNIKDALREVRIALLEADVALSVVRDFIKRVKDRSVGREVDRSLTPGQTFIRIVQSELEQTMGKANKALNIAVQPPAVILVAGLQGSGKTTSVAKLSRFINQRNKKKVLVVSTDIYRPAAIKQLEILASETGIDFFPSFPDQIPADIANAALDHARKQFFDVLLVDTAGRLHVDEGMMAEIQQIHQIIRPIETLFVVDAMTGQDAASTARAFDRALPLTGVILTKADGDARGGAALSICQITGKPIKFIGVGEKSNALEPFYPDRIASRILGMGDVLSFIEEVERNIDQDKASKLAEKVKKGNGFNLVDFQDQLQQMKDMNGMLLDKLLGIGQLPPGFKESISDKITIKMEAIINSMTPAERSCPTIIKGSRKRRIAMGSGTQIQDVNQLLRKFNQTQKMMNKVSGKGGIRKMISQMKSMIPSNDSFDKKGRRPFN